MSCCCKNTYPLCDLVVCDDEDLVIPAAVPADGEYTLELDFLDSVVKIPASLSAGDNFTFDKAGLNERFTYAGRIKGPDGVVVSFTIDSVVYDCLEFTTKRATWTNTSSSSSLS